MFGRRFVVVLVVAGAGLSAGAALAQEDLTRGKTPAQLFASDCADCHKNPRALGQRDNANALASFLRVHYTASRESAAAIAAYLAALGPDPRAGSARPAPARRKQAPPPQDQSNSSQTQPAPKPTEAAPPKPPEPVPEAPAAAPAPAAAAPAASAPASEPPAPAEKPADPQ